LPEIIFISVILPIEFADFCKAQGGLINYSDLASYHALIEEPAHITYRGYDIYTPSSASQGPAELEALNIIERFNLTSFRRNSQLIHIMVEAINLSYADREKYLGDFNFLKSPLNGLLSKNYAEKRSTLINTEKRRKKWLFGNPYPFDEPEYTYKSRTLPDSVPPTYRMPAEKSTPLPKTFTIRISQDAEDILKYKNSSYACAADRWGNLVYATSSLDSPFGAGVVIEPLGFLLNSGIAYFRLELDHPNVLAPGKRPRGAL